MKKDYTVLSKRHIVDKNAMTDEQMELLDQQEGRRRITGTEMDALIMLNVSRVLMHTAMDDLRPFLKEHGYLTRLAPLMGQFDKACKTMTDHVKRKQCKSIEANYNGVTVTVSSLPMKQPQWTNVEQSVLNRIVNQASRMCAMDCTCTREQSKRCELRRAFDNVPGMKEAAKVGLFSGDDACPYLLFEAPSLEDIAQ